jgi:arabinogalactan oligomer/maltooligosaccharide transport system substrate-binding protein
MRSKHDFFLLALAAALLAAAACGGGGDTAEAPPGGATGPVEELVVWHSYRGAENDAFLKVVEQYNAAQPSYHVTTLAVPYDAYPDKITAAVPRGKGPDVFIFAQDRMGGWVEAGNTIEPLDFFIEDDVRERFLPLSMDAMTYRGTTYGLPLANKAITLIYNKAMVAEPPADSEALVRVAKQHTDTRAGRFGLVYAYSDFYYHAALMNAFGGAVFDEQGRPVIDQPANVRAVELMLEWLREDEILPEEPSVALITSLFNGGKAAMVFSGPWFLGEIDESIDYGLAKLPAIVEAGGTPMKPWVTVEGVYVAAPSQHKEGAYDFARYLTGVEAGRVMALEGGQTPANKAVYDIPEVEADPHLAAFREQLQSAQPMPNLPEMSLAWSPLTTAMNAILKGTPPAAALAEAQDEVEAGVDRLRGEG